jgi:hypothetical protein
MHHVCVVALRQPAGEPLGGAVEALGTGESRPDESQAAGYFPNPCGQFGCAACVPGRVASCVGRIRNMAV